MQSFWPHKYSKNKQQEVGPKPQSISFCQTSDLGLRLEVDFVFCLSQEQEEEPSPKFSQKGRY